jgi:hypothetical protein
MLIQAVVTHKHAIQLMHKIDNEREKGIDFQLMVTCIIKDYQRLMFNRHSSQFQDCLANQAFTADESSVPDLHDTKTDNDEGHWAHVNQANQGESQPKRPADEYLSSEEYKNVDASLLITQKVSQNA